MIRIFADGADAISIRRLAADPTIAGFTTNPSLARKAGVSDYRAFGKKALRHADGKPVSIEVISDDFDEMARQAHEIASWGSNAFVKIPVMNTRGGSSVPLLFDLALPGIKLNVTAVFTKKQVREVGRVLSEGTAPCVVSVFAGRVADAGTDPLEHVAACRRILREECPRAEMLWASPRQAYDFVLAEQAGCEIITMTQDLIAKLALRGKDLGEYSQETVRMFYDDAKSAGFTL